MENNTDYRCMGSRIRGKRELHNMTREKLAEKLNVTPRFLSDVESGNKGMCLKNVIRTSRILETSVDYLVGNDTNPGKDIQRKRMEAELLEILRKCDNKQFVHMMAIAESFAESHK